MDPLDSDSLVSFEVHRIRQSWNHAFDAFDHIHTAK